MLATITKPFANLAVSKKLLMGFGLVLLLTLAVTLTGFNAIATILERQSLMADIAESNILARAAGESEKNYALTGNEADYAEALNHMQGVVQLLQKAESGVTNKAQLEQLKRMQAASNGYLEEFERVIQAKIDAQNARETMRIAAEEALETFDNLELEFFNQAREMLFAGSNTSGNDPLNLAETSAALAKQMLELRGSEFNYVMTRSDEALEHWTRVIESMRDVANNLSIWLESAEAAALDKAVGSLTIYEQAFAEYQQTQNVSAAAQDSMVEQARLVMDEAGQAYDFQQRVMAEVGADAYWILGLISVVAIALGLIAALLIARLIVVPLRNTVRVAQRIASGDLTEDLETGRRDEVGQLAAAMQTMTESLRTLIGKISGGVTQIATAAEQLSAIAEETSAGVRCQQEETEQTATAVQQMAATVDEVAKNAQEASLAAEQADAKAQQGDGVVREVVVQINRLKEVVGHSAEAVGKLQDESQRIGSILDVIKAVAEQTNLLALNAAIEAARAGEQGRGFAVVADEVRALASRTQNSTAEIETLIGSLQGVARDAVAEMEGSYSLTQETVDLTGKASTLLAEITAAVSTIERMNHQIAAAAEEQSTAAETINRSVTNVRDVAEKSAAATQQTASSSAELARLGSELQSVVGHFRTQ